MLNSPIPIIINKMINYFENDPEMVQHTLKVYSFAKNIGELEEIENEKLQILELAAILHDIGIKISRAKYNSSAGNYQEIEGPPIVREMLNGLNLSENIISRVCYLVGSHHSYNKIDEIDFQILVESDFLVNIFEGHVDNEPVSSIKEKYFKTKTGISYLKIMYE